MTSRLKWNTTVSWHDLTPRQQEIMLSLARGMSNQEIADDLGIKLSTVRNNIAAVYDWLGFTNRVQALLWILSNEDLAEDVLESV